jgi:Protein of unknown function (DUF2934)
MLTKLFLAAKIGVMQSNKNLKKTGKIADENVASTENAITGETKTKPRTSKSSKPTTETGETTSVKLHRKAKSIPAQDENTSVAAAAASATPSAAPAITHEQIASLAHSYWIERGMQHGSQAEDWLRAERELQAR